MLVHFEDFFRIIFQRDTQWYLDNVTRMNHCANQVWLPWRQ